jgi:hypothetical protein
MNQRGHTSGTALASGSYGHDRWKGGASGGTYTFTAGSTGVNITITITAGSIIQVIEGANLPVSGTYVLSWTGTAQGKIGSGSFGSSGITGTITAGTNTNIEFSTGTCGNVQLEFGSVATSFDYRPFGTELVLCQRYFYVVNSSAANVPIAVGQANGPTQAQVIIRIPTMRSAPTASLGTSTHFQLYSGGTGINSTAMSMPLSTPDCILLNVDVASGLVNNNASHFRTHATSAGSSITLSAEL